jgi:hypothetical protein
MHQLKLLADTAQGVIGVSLTLSWVAKMLELNAGMAGAVGGPRPNILSNISANSCDQVSFECRPPQAEFVAQPQIPQQGLLMHNTLNHHYLCYLWSKKEFPPRIERKKNRKTPLFRHSYIGLVFSSRFID